MNNFPSHTNLPHTPALLSPPTTLSQLFSYHSHLFSSNSHASIAKHYFQKLENSLNDLQESVPISYLKFVQIRDLTNIHVPLDKRIKGLFLVARLQTTTPYLRHKLRKIGICALRPYSNLNLHKLQLYNIKLSRNSY